MGKVKGKHRLDKYYKLAKEHGYRSRASWKLAQLDTKHQFLHSSHAVLDLCAAPGGWMQVAVQRVPVGSLVVGVDLVPIAPVRGAFSIQQDITKPECTARLRKLMKENGCSAFDLVLHDGSPNVGGAWSSEATAQNALVVDAVKLATQLLAPKGTFITKDVDGSDIVLCDYDSDKDQGIQETNPLLEALDEGDGPTQEEITNNWFSQDIFAEAVEQGDLENSASEDEMHVERQEKLPMLEKANEKTAVQNGKEKTAIQNAKKNTENDAAGTKGHKLQASKADDDFEIVPAPGTDSSDDSSSDESEDMDVDKKAEILACAKKMLRKKPREQMLDDAYNKYMFDDDGLPRWFLDEEKRHRQPIKPVTKEEINAMKAQFKEIDARPAKKVAEAKARKKRVAFRKLEKVRKKANTISDQPDISDRSKRKQIEQMYKKAAPKRPQKEYVVAKKGVQVRVGKGKVRVDRRMKKDARGSGPGKRPGKGNSKKGKTAAKGERGGKGAGKGDRGKGPGKASGKPTGRKGRK